MDTDGYTPAINLEKLLRLAHKYGPEALADERLPSHVQAAEQVRQVVCPCLQGDTCICEALANEFEHLTKVFRRQVQALKPKSCPDCEKRWENEGGRVIATTTRSG